MTKAVFLKVRQKKFLAFQWYLGRWLDSTEGVSKNVTGSKNPFTVN